MKFKVLITAPYLIPVLDKYKSILLSSHCEVVVADVEERLSEEQLIPLMKDIDGVICGDDMFSSDVLEASPKLKVLSKWGTGIDSIDQDDAKKRGIVIKNIPNAFSEPVGDTVLGWILSFSRRINEQTETLKLGGWEKLPGHALNESTLGVIGVGNCGKAVIRRAHAFGMNVLGNDIQDIDKHFLNHYDVKMVKLDTLLQQSDYISLNCDLNTSSHHIINKTTLNLMQRHAIVMNAARGPLINEKELAASLKNNLIGGAALDVFEHEPLSKESPLLTMNNILLSAHNANSSPKAWERVHHIAIENMLQVLEKKI